MDTTFLSTRNGLREISRRAQKDPEKHTQTPSETDVTENGAHESTEEHRSLDVQRFFGTSDELQTLCYAMFKILILQTTVQLFATRSAQERGTTNKRTLLSPTLQWFVTRSAQECGTTGKTLLLQTLQLFVMVYLWCIRGYHDVFRCIYVVLWCIYGVL